MLIVLKDARRKSPTFGQAIARWIDDGADNTLIVVPAGVAHGVFFQTAGILTYGLTSCWDGLGEFNCRWDDPGLVSQWPLIAPVLSDRDSAAGAFDAMVDALNAEL
jgi:dTDP-4-dehydrorhamnose 3,5-epimerase